MKNKTEDDIAGAISFPKRNTRFKLEDFFQVQVDVFYSGEFLFLSAKKVRTKSDKELLDELESFDEYGWVISTWCYNYKCYHKIFVCQYRQKAWKNHYRIENMLAVLNGCDIYAGNNNINAFIEWMEFLH